MSDRQRRSGGGSSGSAPPSYKSRASEDPRSSRHASSGGGGYGDRYGGRSSRYERGSGSGHRSRGEHGHDEQPERQWPHETAERQVKHVSFFQQTADQLFHTPPCTGALYIIGTLILFWFIGIVLGAAKFSASTRDVGKVKDLHDLQDAMVLIGQNKRAQGYFLMLIMFIGAMCFMWLYLAMVVLYNAIINNKGIFLWMKRMEAKNEGERKDFKARKQTQADTMRMRYAPGTR